VIERIPEVVKLSVGRLFCQEDGVRHGGGGMLILLLHGR
jgi:hypothetical protein